MSQMNKTERQWTRGQTAAIETKNKTLLISAAAGSGKTATLTERIIRTIIEDENSDIAKMLIVTFTRAAATELRDRIFKALSEKLSQNRQNRRLYEQLIKLGSANISTIDAFYLNVIRQHFTTLGISASARIADTSELELLKKKVMEEIIDEFYDKVPDFPYFAECFIRTKSVYRLSDPLLNIYSDILSYPEGMDFLKNSASQMSGFAKDLTDLFDTPYGNAIKRELIPRFEYYARVLDDARIHAEENTDIIGKRISAYAYDADFTRRVYDMLSKQATYAQMHELFASYDPLRMGAIARGATDDDEGTFYKEERTRIKDDILSLRGKLFSHSPEELACQLSITGKHVSMLYDVTNAFHNRYCEEKQRRNLMDFDDVKRNTYKLLVNADGTPSDIARQYQKQFSDIYIDEYQDVDLVQDRIFAAISNNNRFMVGDIKQSIYGFRGAAPSVFANYRESFYSFDPNAEPCAPEGISAATIFMSENFRCDENVIDFTNLVCSRIFGATADSIGYTAADDLRFAKFPPSSSHKVELAVILTEQDEKVDADDDETSTNSSSDTSDTDALDNEEYEAEYIASKVDSLIGKETLANGKKIEPGDIAILYRSAKMIPYLSEALAKRGILCSEGGGGNYFENPDVLLVLSLLNIVDNPHRDIHMAAVLCSPLYEFTLEELITIRKGVSSTYSLYDALLVKASDNDGLGHKCLAFDSSLTSLRNSSLSLPVDRFLRLVFESDIFVASGLLSDRDSFGEGGNLLRLYDYARTFESGSFKGLYNFIEFINDLIDNDKMLEIAPKERCAERVTLTTMHHSKGLEFPVCFICCTGKKKNMKGLYSSLLYDNSIGAAMKLSDATGFSRVNTPMRESIAMSRFIDEIEEEMRILYVALTRARERLYITATKTGDPDSILFKAQMTAKYLCRYTATHCMSFLDWLLIPFGDASADLSSCALKIIRPSECALATYDAENKSVSSEIIKPEADAILLSQLRKKFAFSYEYTPLTRIPAKLSISRLSPDVLDGADVSASIEPEKKTVVPDFFISGQKHKSSAAERGTATHLFLQFCDLERAKRTGIAEELSRLVDRKFIPENIADIVYTEELEKFIDSPLADRILNASQVIREQRFNLLLPATDFSENEEFKELLENEALAVQGVIDLLLIDKNGDIELYDYKTDRLSSAELSDPALAHSKLTSAHALQLSYYSHAVKLLFGKKCKRVAIYSTHSARLYDLDTVPLRLSNT